MTAFDDFFTAMFIGTGNLLGLAILVSLTIGIMLTWKYAGIFSIIIGVLSAFYYWDNGLGWHGVIMVLMSIFTLGYLIKKERKE